MKKRGLILVLITGFFLSLSSFGYCGKITPGIIIDDFTPETTEFIKDLKKELNALLFQKINISDENILSSKWSSAKARENYSYLINKKDIDLIITFGVLSSGVAVEKGKFPKPLMAVGIVDTEVQNLTPPVNNSSGIKNLTYILFNKSLERDLELFHEVYPYKKVGIVAEEHIIKAVIKNNEPIKRIIKENNADFGILSVNNGIDDVLDKIKDYDSVYLGYFGNFEGEEKKKLIKGLSELGIPAFGSSIEDIKFGALAAVSPEQDFIKVLRRVALNTESFSQGEEFSRLAVNLEFQEKLTINMDAAKKIGFSPKFSTLSKAEVVNSFEESETSKMSLEEIVEEALKRNLGVNISRLDIGIAEKKMKGIRSKYLPSLTLNGTETIIDDKRAKASMGTQAERTASGSIKAEQVLFSEGLSSNLYVGKKQYEAEQESYNTKVLDVINECAKAYFDVLKAKTLVKIRKDNLDLTKKHLSISKQREAVGYSGKSDIYRWESSLAAATTELFEAVNNYRVSKISLNQILNRELGSPISIIDESIDGELYNFYLKRDGYSYIDNPEGFKKFTLFLVEEGRNNSPELKNLTLLSKAYKRELKRYKRERYLPVASLGGEAAHVFDRSGEGSNVKGVDPEDDQWSVSLNLSWPIFSGGSKIVNKDKAELEIEKISSQISSTRQNIEFNIRSAVLNTVNKIVNLESSKTSAEFANKSLVLIQDSYARGKVSMTELINAQSESLSADLNYMNSVYGFLTSVFSLERAVGKFTLFSDYSENIAFLDRMNKYMLEKNKQQNHH